jgi:hypothetical protein
LLSYGDRHSQTVTATVTENIKMSAKECLGYELKKNKTWLDEGCSKKTSQIAVVQNPGEIRVNWDVKNIRREASTHFRNTWREYLKERINELK